MKKDIASSYVIPTGFAIFSMLFGAGNLMFPITVGRIAGSQHPVAMFGFLVTAVILPLVGLVSIILCNGDYQDFFDYIGKIPGSIAIFACLTFIGPVYAMPRIVGVSYTVMKSFFPGLSILLFTGIFLALTFIISYKESRIMQILGNVISPLLFVSLMIIIIKGIFSSATAEITTIPATTLLWKNIIYGYNTLDLLGAIFFSSVVIGLLSKSFKSESKKDIKTLVIMGLKAGVLGTFLLTLVYIGLGYLGAYHGQNLFGINEAEVFSTVSLRVLGSHGAIVIAIAVLMACLSTVVALATIFAEYVQKITKYRVCYITALLLTLFGVRLSSNLGLTKLMSFYEPIIIIAHPALILLTFLIIANKFFGYKFIKTPVLITFIASIVIHYWY